MAKEEFINAGFTIVGAEDNENKLLSFLKENYPSVIRDNEINIEELKTVLGLPIDEKVNGYGLNFVGRNFARAKYAQKTEKELRLNTTLSKEIDTTQHLVLKGDNLDSLKILKNHYSGKIKCICIDPPYNTKSEEFVYPDKFDKEEAEVLGLANLSESDFERMDFSFKTKKSHNGWLAFMYPRLLLARDLLSKDGVIFISIDENEHAQLKLLCDEIFGDENFAGDIVWKNSSKNDQAYVSMQHEYVLVYAKSKVYNIGKWEELKEGLQEIYKAFDALKKKHKSDWQTIHEEGLKWYNQFPNSNPVKDSKHYSWMDESGVYFPDNIAGPNHGQYVYDVLHPITGKICKPPASGWRFPEDTLKQRIRDGLVHFGKDHTVVPNNKTYLKNTEYQSITSLKFKDGRVASNWLKNLFGVKDVFTNPKDCGILLSFMKAISVKNGDIVLDFFAGSGSTGEAVMQLNAEDGGNCKFILCQIDEPIKENKPAYKFCIDNNLPPVISSITIERLKRAGEKIAKDIEAANSKVGLFEEDKKQVPDIGFKVFDSIEAPKLKVDETTKQISIIENETDALSRIYNMIFTIGLDEPSQVPEMVLEDCIYKIGNHYYITNCDKLNSYDYSNAIKNGKVFIDGWTASLNGTLQNYKEDVKIIF
ncbi:site-specific DNA-methyltransferase [Flavobacterium nackdongense]|uniref:site-specific DNA-methyltransferase (adenine-specific) n=1 Tax=Flavobacterium nackdongense TaxID=2547394 RepID=A0A4P6YD52_9FLAO|nr:site-specific DNA-methyltransferase [Flavobacterium nackdongense]QBN18675.1 site-specific DNA-methyltransferase [Flavobacterium nackdongense]